MKKGVFLGLLLGLLLNACVPAFLQPEATPSLAPISVEDLQETATVLAQGSSQPLSLPTLAPSITPFIKSTPTQQLPTETAVPPSATITAASASVLSITDTSALGTTPVLEVSSTPTVGAPHPLHYGTMPPNLPFGNITLINRSKVEVYISLRCVTKDDYVTIIEYPVGGAVKTSAIAGKYSYVVWVGGRQITGEFSLGKSQDLTIKIFKDRVEIK
ncbi:MAG: hypothetical protein HY864_07565 [Chloroflexi bacterium]|nr:hypothetical protein [Chloroflexota bacterium]